MAIDERMKNEIVRRGRANPNALEVWKGLIQEDEPVTYGTVRYHLQRAGIELTAGKAAQGGGTNKQSPERRAEIIRALEAEPNAAGVAKKLGGISPAGVWQIAKKAGIKLNPGQGGKTLWERLRANPDLLAKHAATVREVQAARSPEQRRAAALKGWERRRREAAGLQPVMAP
jgi:hypothetical protein